MIRSWFSLALVGALMVSVAAGCGGADPSAPDGNGGTGGVGGSGGSGGVGGSGGTGGGGTGGTDVGEGGTGGVENPRPKPEPSAPDGHQRDYDCDGLSDAEEFGTIYPSGLRTDPFKADTDGDGIPDGVEVGRKTSPDPTCTDFVGDQDPSTTTDPTNPDTDGDGIPDGVEDRNHNGRVDPAETDPNKKDTDGDGIPDGIEDENRNGKVDPGETDPRLRDSDGDGIPDGVEDSNQNGIWEPDLGETDPTNPDTDGDGLLDGEEDLNWNQIVDPGETDPLVPDNPWTDSDGDGLSDIEELYWGTDPHESDSDGDGIPDGVEVWNGTDPLSKDTDCDGIPDGVEDANRNGIWDLGETDPRRPDTDGDGLPDGLELGYTSTPEAALCAGRFLPDLDPSTTTDPLARDTDRDGLDDGEEDLNRNGRVDAGETDPELPDTDDDGIPDGIEIDAGTDPLSPDTDCDGIPDGVEDANRNGIWEPELGETDPRNPDTDNDGLPDGLELGYETTPEPRCGDRFKPDLDPQTTTNPLNPDTDGDGVMDGAEDGNNNGRLDAGETDPLVADDFDPAVIAACGTANLSPILFHAERAADVRFATRAGWTESHLLVDGAGRPVGRSLFAPTGPTQPVPMAAFALVKPAEGDAVAQEAADRARFGGIGSPVIQPFTTWDGYPAVRALYDLSSSEDLKDEANRLIRALIPGATGLLSGSAGVTGPFKFQVEYVVRDPRRAVVVGALVEASSWVLENVTLLDDLANGTALGQFPDATNVACDRFETAGWPTIDFLFVIDNSGSMGDKQTALGNAADAMAAQLENAAIDWRIATITTDLDRNGTGNKRLAPFTRDVEQFKIDAKPGTNGSGTERGFQPVRCALGGGSGCTHSSIQNGYFLPKAVNDPHKIRPDASLVIIFISDEPEQSTGTVESWVEEFKDWDGEGNAAFAAGIITCDSRHNNNCVSHASRLRYGELITEMGGVLGDLQDLSTISPTINAIMNTVIGATSAYELTNPPISASIKIAVDPAALVTPESGGCNAADLPRSRQNGFDYDGASQRINFFGDCRPRADATGSAVAASYRYWIDLSPDPYSDEPCGGCVSPLLCNVESGICECPWDCGGGAPNPNYRCNQATCQNECPADCGQRKPGEHFICDQASCTWTCDATCNGQPKPGENLVCDQSSCTWSCPEDCGGGLEANQFCDRLSCEPTCAPDCGGTCGANEVCDTDSCGCECQEPAISPAPGFVFDEASCSFVCEPELITECGGARQVDPTTCQCICPVNCGGCDGVCDQQGCVCYPFG